MAGPRRRRSGRPGQPHQGELQEGGRGFWQVCVCQVLRPMVRIRSPSNGADWIICFGKWLVLLKFTPGRNLATATSEVEFKLPGRLTLLH